MIISALFLFGCGKDVETIDDVDVIESVEDVAIDTGLDEVDTDLLDLGDLVVTEETPESMDETASLIGIEETDTDLIELGELI